MVRPNRLKNYTFSSSDLTADANGAVTSYSDVPINGRVTKIVLDAGNWAANGSFWVRTSGLVPEQLYYEDGASNADTTVYPVVFGVDNANTTGSPEVWMQRCVNSNLELLASGTGNGKSGVSLTVYYV